MCTFEKRGGALYYTYFFPNIFHNLFLKTRKIHRDVRFTHEQVIRPTVLQPDFLRQVS